MRPVDSCPLDLSSKRRSWRQRMPKHSPGRLEASSESQLRHGRPAIFILGAERGWSSEQRWVSSPTQHCALSELRWIYDLNISLTRPLRLQRRRRICAGIGISSWPMWGLRWRVATSRAYHTIVSLYHSCIMAACSFIVHIHLLHLFPGFTTHSTSDSIIHPARSHLLSLRS
jgi:hypothetical protein